MPICTENVEVNRGKVAPWNLVVLTVLYTPTGKGREVGLVNWDSGTSRVVVTFDVIPTQPGQCTL